MEGNQKYWEPEVKGIVQIVVIDDNGGAEDNPYGNNDCRGEFWLGGRRPGLSRRNRRGQDAFSGSVLVVEHLKSLSFFLAQLL